MTRSLVKRAVRLFRSEYAPRHIRRANARKWLASVQWLGPRWLYRGGKAKWGHGEARG